MKIIMAVPYIFAPELSNGERNRSGLAYMIRYIADEISKQYSVRVITQSYFSSKEVKMHNGGIICKKSILDVLLSFRPCYLLYALKMIHYDKLPFTRALRVIAYFLCGGFLEREIKRSKPDVVYIHSLTYYSIPFLLACERTNSRIAITLHGLMSLDRDYVNVSDAEACLEQFVLKKTSQCGIAVSMIASGMKNRMSKQLELLLDNVQVICNFCGNDLSPIPKEKSVENLTVLCIGSIYPLKNQLEVIKAFSALCLEDGRTVRLKIIGDGTDKEMLEQYVIDNNLKNITFSGRLSHKELAEEYRKASLVVLASICEGFGLPVLEGYWFGVPAVMFDDLDAFEDLYSPDTMIPVTERSTQALTRAMKTALEREWSIEKIQNFAEQFSSQNIGEQYFDFLKRADASILPKGFLEDFYLDIKMHSK